MVKYKEYDEEIKKIIIHFKIKRKAKKINRNIKSIYRISKQWKISLEDAYDLCKNFEERQTKSESI